DYVLSEKDWDIILANAQALGFDIDNVVSPESDELSYTGDYDDFCGEQYDDCTYYDDSEKVT
ncbi:MAG: hypothetical protein ACP5M0_16150, partial [Desulfomonilaceae bacterium]